MTHFFSFEIKTFRIGDSHFLAAYILMFQVVLYFLKEVQ
jgi:hypothetical protein